MRELSEMPAQYIHIIYKEYFEMLKDEERRKAHEQEQVGDELMEGLGG